MDNLVLNNFLALQILVECLADELIESDIINRENLDKRVQEKIEMLEKLNDALESAKTEMGINLFHGKIGEA